MPWSSSLAFITISIVVISGLALVWIVIARTRQKSKGLPKGYLDILIKIRWGRNRRNVQADQYDPH